MNPIIARPFRPTSLSPIAYICIAIGVACMGSRTSAQTTGGARDSFAVQEARNKAVEAFGTKSYYPVDKFNLEDLPSYVPEQKVSGVIRIWGSDMLGGGGLKKDLEDGFRKHHPDVTFAYNLKGPALAFAGLLAGDSDIGPSRRITWESLLAFQRVYNHDPLVITGMTGWAVNPAFAIMVNKKNPLTGIIMKQLDGIFGAERNGGWVGTTWHPEFARGPEENIRTWGQLGLTGEWKDKPINVYGYSLRYLYGPRFAEDVLKGSDKWNEKLRQYSQIATPDGKLLMADQQMADELAKDPYGIAYYSQLRSANPQVRPVALAVADGGPYFDLTLETVRNHTYALFDRMYFYINRKPGTPLDPKVKEFMRYLLSREGQQAVAKDGTMLPLTAEMIREERQKLE